MENASKAPSAHIMETPRPLSGLPTSKKGSKKEVAYIDYGESHRSSTPLTESQGSSVLTNTSLDNYQSSIPRSQGSSFMINRNFDQRNSYQDNFDPSFLNSRFQGSATSMHPNYQRNYQGNYDNFPTSQQIEPGQGSSAMLHQNYQHSYQDNYNNYQANQQKEAGPRLQPSTPVVAVPMNQPNQISPDTAAVLLKYQNQEITADGFNDFMKAKSTIKNMKKA